MNKFFDTLNAKFAGPMAKFSEQRHLRAIRDGVVSAIPFIIVGSFFLLIGNFPFVDENGVGWVAASEWQALHKATIVAPYYITFGAMALYMCFGIGANLAKTYKLPEISGGLIAIAAFLMSIWQHVFDPHDLDPELLTEAIATNPVLAETAGAWGKMINLGALGAAGVFTAIVVAIISIEIMRLCVKYHITIKMPEQVPTSVARSFEAIVPVAIVVILLMIVSVIFGFDLEGAIGVLVGPVLQFVGQNIAGGIIIVFINSFFWSFGIHGSAITDPITQPMWASMLESNASAFAANLDVPYILAQPFFQFFVYVGGSGATIGLIIATLIVARSTYLKTIGKATIVPAIFNINEPAIFGFPIMLNPVLIIPFIVTPVVLMITSFTATSLGLVDRAFSQPPWTLPAPIGAFLATGDWRAIILSIINIGISVFIYLPFVKMYDKIQLNEEAEIEAEKALEVK